MVGTGNAQATADAAELATRFDVDVVPTVPEDTGLGAARRSLILRRIFLTLLAVFLFVGVAGFLGVRSQTVTARGGGYELSVTYGAVSRSGLATPWSAQIPHPGGFDGPIRVSSSSPGAIE